MPPLDTWLRISLYLPAWSIPLLILLVTAALAWTYRVYRQRRARMEELLSTGANPDQTAGSGERHDGDAVREVYLQFLYNISHEVSNPLQSILTNLDNLASCPPEDADRRHQYHTVISAEVRRLADLTDRLRLLSRLETPGVPVKREPVNLKGVIEAVLMAYVEQAEANHVRLSYVGPERPPRVLGDREQLHQVLANLVDNAVKYSRPEGGVVVISVQEQEGCLFVRVSDEGIGIPEVDLAYIFDTAYRARDAQTFRRKGSGLGLAIARRIIEQHGGEIEVRSRPDSGTEFGFSLPVYHSDQVDNL